MLIGNFEVRQEGENYVIKYQGQILNINFAVPEKYVPYIIRMIMMRRVEKHEEHKVEEHEAERHLFLI